MRPQAVSLGGLCQLRSTIKIRPRSGWLCSYRRNSTQSLPTKATKRKPYYVTTPIFYVNAAPHVGHLYSMVLADILKRWQVLKGEKAILSTGVDEHGMKIQQAAEKAGTPPQEFCDNVAETFKKLAERAGIANDYFVRTTDKDHRDAVQHFWTMLQTRGYIYESKHEGWYCVSDETYYPENTIEKRVDPVSGRTFMAAHESGQEVEWSSETNYHFRLSALKDRLLEFYKENPTFVVPEARMKDVIKWVSEDLQDLSISRPVERLSWGIRVPDDNSQTIYVWLDALVNYITKAGYPWAPGQENALGWPADVQVVGKDIVRFHCIYWPAFLLALDIQPPKQILTHAHWTLGKRKMAKSTGNVVNPFFAIDRFGVDAIRYYLAHNGGILNDSDYSNQYIVKTYKHGLQGGLGGLASRLLRSQVWSVPVSITACQIPSSMNANIRAEMKSTLALAAKLDSIAESVNKKMEELDPGAALHIIMDAIFETNKYMAAEAPWDLVKIMRHPLKYPNAVSARNQLYLVIYHAAEALRIAGILLQPYMPAKAALLLDMLGVQVAHRTFSYARVGRDETYGTPRIPVGNTAWDALFPPLPVE